LFVIDYQESDPTIMASNYKGLDITGKVVLVTGGTTGLGKAISLGLASAGAKVVAGSSSAGKVDAVARELGHGHHAMQIDVTSEESVAKAVATTIEKFGRLDAVVNAAGVIARGPSIDFATSEFERIIKVNLTGSFIVAKAAAKAMLGNAPDAQGHRGSVVFIASLNSYISLSEVLAYAASKSGVLGLVRGMANEWAAKGIRVNAIAPGVFPTDLNRPLIEGTPRGEWLKKHTPEGRFGYSDELVGATIYLISPSASYTNGHTLIVDGGFLSRGV
jgi:NAD(P)-dependent dehydrogenase (short-subunit alcohol dehydrogenase family)